MVALTIGVPAYNNATTLTAAVTSLLGQDYGDFEIVISDDCSSDQTRQVAQELVRMDPRVRYLRQEGNLRYQNFGFLLRNARTPYFMWAAGDDRWEREFVSVCISELERHPYIVSAVSRVQFEVDGRPTALADGTYTLDGSLRQNLSRFLSAPRDNSRMYGVFRTEAAQRSFPRASFHAYDWGFSAATLRFGGHLEIPKVLMHRQSTPPWRYLEMIRVDAAKRLDRALPVLAMSRWLLAQPGIPREPRVLSALLALNLDMHFWYMRHYHARYSRAVRPLYRLWWRQRHRFVADDAASIRREQPK